ncbi:hypothetical protein QFC19_001540 [Naganishia cerealis]|uniref:Uncharacterized protein n=1 Tax=Naganishia cerealis TaxID=610337 RepID=A0ACC2WGY7_9TREE|nr:hypothetical protein QFC19_001540 [Naganishia cerealis]
MSGTMLGRVYDHFDGATLRHERGSLEIRGLADSTYPSTTLARQEFTHDNPDLPTVDVVIAYYNEPTSALRRLTSRLKKELTWARVNLIIYHNGIAGFDDQLASRFTNGALDSRVADEDTRLREVLSTIAQLKAETRADAVLPRKNVGRDMGVFLDHIFSHYGLFEDPLDLLNMYPFPEMAIAWDLFHPGTSLPKTPILTAYRGQMVISRDRIKQTERQVWEHTTRILVSERDDAEHVDGFGWKDEPEG